MLINDKNAILPDMISYPVQNGLHSLVLLPDTEEFVLNSLPVGKGPDGISNRILRKLTSVLYLDHFAPHALLFFGIFVLCISFQFKILLIQTQVNFYKKINRYLYPPNQT